jgi:hypothetical protein
VIKNITITFREDETYLQQIRMQELSGDITTITFMNTILNAPLDSTSFEVRPVREHSSLRFPHSVMMQLSRKEIAKGHREPVAFSHGVKHV